MLLTLLVVPLSLHLLDDAEVEHGVPALAPAVQRRQEVRHDALVPSRAGAGQARQVLQDQLLPVLGETLNNAMCRCRWQLNCNIFRRFLLI